MPEWPPIKAWTNVKMNKYHKYFVAIDYGVSHEDYWVNLVSLIDGRLCMNISFESLKDKSIWLPGWEDLGDLEVDFEPKTNTLNKKKSLDLKQSLHPSEDSGLTIPINAKILRPWYPE